MFLIVSDFCEVKVFFHLWPLLAHKIQNINLDFLIYEGATIERNW